MSLSLDQFHERVKKNRLLRIFTVFTRILLALAFLPSGLTKLMGNRFTILGIDDPIGFFFEALYRTGFYWRFLGICGVAVTDSANRDARGLGVFSFNSEYLRHHSFDGLYGYTADHGPHAVGEHLPALLGL